MVIGEGPGETEDQRGEPFVGPAGEMLDKMLERVVGRPRANVYIANVVKCRPPANRNPLPDEVATCLPYLRRQIRAVSPKAILVLGSVAARSLLGTEEGITRLRGRWTQVDGVPVMPTFHPAYLLRKPEDKRFTFDDLKELRRRLDEPSDPA
jgi:DNA polymerase